MNNDKKNNDPKTVSSFGDEWARFDEKKLIGDSMLTFLIPIPYLSLRISARQSTRFVWDAEMVVGLL